MSIKIISSFQIMSYSKVSSKYFFMGIEISIIFVDLDQKLLEEGVFHELY